MSQSASQKYLIWKKIGETPLEAMENFRSESGISTEIPLTYAGRLDPAASGQLLILRGDECKQKSEYNKLDKTYEFSILVGFETDTLDLLGLVTKFSDATAQIKNLGTESVNFELENLIGKHQWSYPAYSSKPVDGKPLWQHAREGGYDQLLELDLVPNTESEIKDIQLEGVREIVGNELLQYLEILAKKVTGDFRQDEILGCWREVVDNSCKYQIIECKSKVGSGTYVRSIVNHLGQSLTVPMVTFSITRSIIHDL